MMSDFRMRLIHATADVTIENEARPDSRCNRHIDQPALILAGAPTFFSQSRGIGIVLHGHAHLKDLAQVPNWILAFPMGKEVDIADLARQRIDRSGGSNPNPR